MEDDKKHRILESATKVFAEKGYQYATISEIAKEAGISTGLTYSYFANKLDVLLSIILIFLETINSRNKKSLTAAVAPLDKLYTVMHNFEDLLIKDMKALYLVKVLNEALPHIVMIKDKKLQEKRKKIILENKSLIKTIDDILAHGQKKGVFSKTLKPSVQRQVLCGAIERVIYGLFFTTYSGEDIGYSTNDAHEAIIQLIDSFICTKR